VILQERSDSSFSGKLTLVLFFSFLVINEREGCVYCSIFNGYRGLSGRGVNLMSHLRVVRGLE
jgi:hypothetical protein